MVNPDFYEAVKFDGRCIIPGSGKGMNFIVIQRLYYFVFLMVMIVCPASIGDIAGAAEGADDPSEVMVYDLEKCLERGLEVSPRLAAAAAELRKARAEKGSQRGGFFPTLSVNSSWESLSSIDSEGHVTEDYLDKKSQVVNLRLSQPLFTGFSIYNVYQKAALNVELTEAWKRREEIRLIMDIHLLFLNLLKAREDVTTLRDSVRRLEVNDEAARAFFDKQMISYAQVLQAGVELAEARQQLSQAENRVEISRSQLNIILGFSGDRHIEYAGDLKIDRDFTRTLTECLDYAYTNRPEMTIADKSIQIAQQDRRISRGRFSPRVSADVNYLYRNDDFKEPGRDLFGPYDRDRENTYWTAALRLEWNFGLGGQQFYQHSQTGHEIDRLRQNRRSTMDQIDAEVRTYYMSLKEAEGRIEFTRAAVEAAREVYDRTGSRYALRLATISELLDSQARLSRAETGHNQAFADYLLSLARLYHSMGWTMGLEKHIDEQE